MEEDTEKAKMFDYLSVFIVWLKAHTSCCPFIGRMKHIWWSQQKFTDIHKYGILCFKTHAYFFWSHMCMSGYCGFSIFYRGHRKCFKLCLAAKHPLKMCRFSKTARTFLSPRKKTYPKPSQIVFLQVCKYAPSLLLHTKTIRDIIDCTLKGGWLLL